MAAVVARFAAACRFLTIFPLPGHDQDQQALAGSVPYFPLVGMVLGLLAALCGWLGGLLFPGPVRAVLLTAVLASFSGGLHLDGLADTADGFLSSRPRERILDIMHDSRIGAMGVVALILVLALKISALSGLKPMALIRCAVLMPVAGRCAIVLLMGLFPYARPQGGLGALFAGYQNHGIAAVALLSFLCAALIVGGFSLVLPLAVAFLGTVLGFGLLCRRVIGGVTGDTLGAGCELAEMSVALVYSLGAW